MEAPYNTQPLVELMNEWYSPKELADTLDDVLFYYCMKRLEEGCTCREDAAVVSLLKELRDAFRKV